MANSAKIVFYYSIKPIMINAALLDLLREQKIGQISITELCDQADINRKTFYNHYPDD